MESENLLAAVFPDQLACQENIVGEREIPNHPLVHQTIEDCLSEAMDIDGLIEVLKKIETGAVQCIARDLPEPSPIAHEILNAKPYAFLDDAPLEERRTHAVYTRRSTESARDSGLGILDAAAIEKVRAEAWPRAASPDELHEALLLVGAATDEEVHRLAPEAPEWLSLLKHEMRAGQLTGPLPFWVPAERLPMIHAVYPDSAVRPDLRPPESASKREWESAEAVKELVRGRMEVIGPMTAALLANFFQLPQTQVDGALLGLEAEGFILRGRFTENAQELEWCDRRLLARIHRLTINRLRAEIQPVSIADFQRFLLAWQRVDKEHRVEGFSGVETIVELLDGYELPSGAWEPEVLALRVKDYNPQWLDQLCFTGHIGWGRLTQPQNLKARPFAPVRSSPVSIFTREHLPHWLNLSERADRENEVVGHSPDTALVLEALSRGGALFFAEIVKKTGLLPSRVEQSLAELTARGTLTADAFEGLRAMLVPADKRIPFADIDRKRHHKAITSLEFAGRWSVLRHAAPAAAEQNVEDARKRDEALDVFARVLLRRYGVMFRRLLDREALNVTWFELARVYRRLEARGEIRGGYFVSGVSGEQFALPEAIGLLRSMRKSPGERELIVISGADPLNLSGILTPGPRITSITASRIVLRDGTPVAALEGGKIVRLDLSAGETDQLIERTLRIGTMPVALRRYYS